MIRSVEWLLATQGLWRHKVRSLLALAGIAVGALAVAFSTALTLGLRAFVEREFQSRPEFWRVLVHTPVIDDDVEAAPPEAIAVRGQIAPQRQQRLRLALAERYFQRYPRRGERMLTAQRLAELATLPDVEAVQAYRTLEAQARLPQSQTVAWGTLVIGPLEELAPRLLCGRLPTPDAGEIVVSELVLYDLGRGNDADLETMLGTEVSLVVGRVRQSPPLALARVLTGRLVGDELTRTQLDGLERLARQLPQQLHLFELPPAERAAIQTLLSSATAANSPPVDATTTVAAQFRICGVARLLTAEEKKRRTPLDNWELARGDLFVAPGRGAEVLETLPWIRAADVGTALIRVRPGGDVLGVVQAIEAQKLRTISAAKWFTSAQREVALITTGLNLFALLALGVATVGITNTLIANVRERQREIGILRSVGATQPQIRRLFLLEGALLGGAGGLLGLATARLLMWPAEAWLNHKMKQLAIDEKLMSQSFFLAPWWLWVVTWLFVLVWALCAALLPAQRAARLDPVQSLRYE
jgi:putative ABC transport system permease protein